MRLDWSMGYLVGTATVKPRGPPLAKGTSTSNLTAAVRGVETSYIHGHSK